MEIFKVDDILEEINAYNINQDNCIEFLLQDKGRSDDIAFFFYKSSLLQLIQCRVHLDKMLAFYYGVNNEYLISEEISKVYKSFLQGDTEILYSVFRYAEEVINDFYKLLGTREIEYLSSSNTNSFNTITFWLKKLDVYVKYKRSKLNGLKVKKGDKFELESQVQLYDGKIKLMVEKINAFFKDTGAEFLLGELNLEQAFVKDPDDESESFYNKFNSYYNFATQYHRLINDIINMTLVIKNYLKIKRSIIDNKSLASVCLMIRSALFGENNLTFRKYRLKQNNRMMAETTPPENISKYFDKLSIQFRDCLAEQDIDLFIRKCADFHYDFLKVHPFSDGNGRTARVLLITMLMSRNIMLPTLYYDYDDKCNFYITSDTALDGDYRNVEQNLFAVLGRYYPNVLPKIPETKKAYYEVNDGSNNRCIKR